MRKGILSIFMILCIIAGNLTILRGINIKESSVFAADAFLYEDDTWGFSASSLIDGSGPYITSALQRRLMSGKTIGEKQRIEERLSMPLTDISYGMALLEVLHYNGLWNVSDISNKASVLHEVPVPSRNDSLVSFINYCNLLQFTDTIVSLDEKAISEGNSMAVKNAESAALNGSPALIRMYSSKSSDAVTAVIYGSEKGTWIYNGTRYNSRILLAYPANTSFSDDSCLYYNSSSGQWAVPKLNMSYISGAVLGAVISNMEVLSKNSYDPAKLPKAMIERVFIEPDQWEVPINIYQSGIPESIGISMDIDLSPAAREILSLSYGDDSYDLGDALPLNLCSIHVNTQALIFTAVINSAASSGIICDESKPVITYLFDSADENTIRSTAQKYNISLQHDDEHGDYYAFPIYFNTNGVYSYYSDINEKDEFPITIDSEICVVVSSKEMTTSATTAKTFATTTTSTSVSSRIKTTSTNTVPTTKPISQTVSSLSSSLSDTSDTTTTPTTSSSITSTKTTTITTVTSISTTTKISTTKLSFDWGKDNWQWQHDLLVPEYMADGYRLLDSHNESLSASLDPMERRKLDNIINQEWLGAEYGMAVTEILAKNGVFSVSMWDPSVKSIYDIDLSDERNLSLISYYQLLQENNSIQQEIAWTSAFATKKSVLSQLISMASASSRGGDMTLVCLFSSTESHATIAYGVEYGLWQLGKESYDGRVMIADPYLDCFSDESCLYFKSSTLEWCVPNLRMYSSDKDTFIGLASNSIPLINDSGYFMGTLAYSPQHAYIPILEVPVDSGELIVSSLGSYGDNIKTSEDMRWFSTVASSVTHRRTGLDYNADGFEIYPLNNGNVDYKMSFERCLLSVKADNVESVAMLPEGIIDLNAIESSFEISITSESELPWDNVSISGDNINEITAEHIGDGILLTGEKLEVLTISANFEVRKMSTLSDGRTYTKALIYAEGNGTIGILVDADGDGECETMLDNFDAGDFLCGDVNLDGGISIVDVVYLSKFNANIIELNSAQLRNAECLADGELNAADVQALMDFVSEKIGYLPVVL